MKKMTFKAVVILAILAFSTNAFALATITNANQLTIGGSTFNPSTLVTLSIASTATDYAAISKHLNGSKEYGTLSSGSTIESRDKAVGTTVTAVSSSTALGGSW